MASDYRTFLDRFKYVIAIGLVAILVGASAINVAVSTLPNPTVATYNKLAGVRECVYTIATDGTTTYAQSCDTGAILSSGTDADSVIQSALNAMSSGGMLFIKKATYSANTPITITYSGTTIDSDGATIRATADVGASAMLSASDKSNITVRNIVLDANNVARRTLMIVGDTVDISNITVENVETKNTISGFIWPGLRISAAFSGGTASNVVVNNVYVHDHPDATFDTVSFGRINGLIISGSTFENLGKNVLFYGGGNEVITGNHFMEVPVISVQADNYTFSGNHVRGESTHTEVRIEGFSADGNPDASGTRNVVIDGNVMTDTMIKVAETNATIATKDIVISNNNLGRDTVNTTDGNDAGILVQSQNQNNAVTITGNYISGHGRAGIELIGANYTSITNNYLIDNGGDSGVSVRGNIIDLQASPKSYNNLISNNISVGSTITLSKHLWLRGDNNQVLSNTFAGTASTVIQNDGSGNVIRNNAGYITEAKGTGTINNGATSATITHGLSYTPSAGECSVIFTENPTNDPGNSWISSITSTQFTVNVRADPGASNLDFSWACRRI